jgi:hypothetical protein
MIAKRLIAAFTVLAATDSVFAQEFVEPDANFVSTRSRAEVIAELVQARADGTLVVDDATYPPLPAKVGTKTRAEVRVELEQYQHAHPSDLDSMYAGS